MLLAASREDCVQKIFSKKFFQMWLCLCQWRLNVRFDPKTGQTVSILRCPSCAISRPESHRWVLRPDGSQPSRTNVEWRAPEAVVKVDETARFPQSGYWLGDRCTGRGAGA